MHKEYKMQEGFDINAVGQRNGKIFGLPFSYEESLVVIQPVTWEVTVSYQSGTAKAPKAILEASPQLDFYDFLLPDAWKKGIFMLPFSKDLYKLNRFLREQAEEYIHALENAEALDLKVHQTIIEQIQLECKLLNNTVEQQALSILNDGKVPGVLGGDHSTPLGNIKAALKYFPNSTLLQIDAHADLRPAYEGFQYSHASIMYNVLEETQLKKLVQVGIRDFCEQEYNYIQQSKGRIITFFDSNLQQQFFAGKAWMAVCEEIIKELGYEVYVSLDIDGLQPFYCPHTGTPVPGGLSFEQVCFLLDQIVKSGRKIVGFDLTEVVPNKKNPWNEIVGARMLYKLCVAAIASQNNLPRSSKNKKKKTNELLPDTPNEDSIIA